MLVLPLPVGPVTSTIPQGRRMFASSRASAAGSKPSRVRSRARWARSRSRSTILLTEERRQTRHPEIDLPCRAPLASPDPDPAVLRKAPLRDVELGHHLDARGDRVAHRRRRRQCMLQHAVDAVPDPQLVLVRLDVDVACAPLDRRGQDDVDEPDHRGFVAGRSRRRGRLSDVAWVRLADARPAAPPPPRSSRGRAPDLRRAPAGRGRQGPGSNGRGPPSISTSDATTGLIGQPAARATSSRARELVGSAAATTSTGPDRSIGTI